MSTYPCILGMMGYEDLLVANAPIGSGGIVQGNTKHSDNPDHTRPDGTETLHTACL